MDHPAPSAATAPLSRIARRALRWSLIWLGAATLLSGTAVVAVWHASQRAAQAQQHALAQQTATRTKLARVNDEARDIRAKIHRYQELLSQGRIAAERRSEWIETLRQIKAARKLLGLDYELAPQRRLDDKGLVGSHHAVLTSTMQIDLPLLHENDLLGLLADLSARVHAVISVKRCVIERIPAVTDRHAAAPLHAQCELDWITLQETT